MERKAVVLPQALTTPISNESVSDERLYLHYESQRNSIKNIKTSPEEVPLLFFEKYINTPEVSEIIDKLKSVGGQHLSYENIRYSLNKGLINLAKPKKFPELPDYKQKNIASSFTEYFYSTVESISRISIENKPPSSSIIQILIGNPNSLEPNFYESYFNKIKHDGYFSKTNIYVALNRSPKNAKEELENNNKTFNAIIATLTLYDPTRTINYSVIRRLVDSKRQKAEETVTKDPSIYFLRLDQKQEIERPKEETNNNTELLEKFKQLLKDEIGPLEERISQLEHQNEELSKALGLVTAPKVSENIETRPQQNSRPNVLPPPTPVLTQTVEVPTQRDPTPIRTTFSNNPEIKQSPIQIQKEKPTTTMFTPTQPIDYISSPDLTTEQQQKIKKIKAKNLDNSFAQDWVIEYYVVHYPDNTEKKLKEDEIKMIEWKDAIRDNKEISEVFKEHWVMKHFIVYYPDDYKRRYYEAAKTFNNLKSIYEKYDFPSDVLRHIVVYYYNDRINAIQRGLLLYRDLKKEFFETELIGKNSSNISRYIIHNFVDPANDIRKDNEKFKLLLKKAKEDPDNFFYSQGENKANSEIKSEISPEGYLRLLFEHHPIQTENSIAKIKEAYQQLQSEFENDDFFGIYKNIVLKKVAISSTEKPALGYRKLKSKISHKK